MDIYITTTCLIKQHNFLKGDKLEDVTLVDYHDGCSTCVEAHTDEFYKWTFYGIDYYIPAFYAVVSDDDDVVVDGTLPIESFMERVAIPYPGEEPIKDYEKAYEEMLNIKLTDDPYVKSYQRSTTPNDPGKNDGN